MLALSCTVRMAAKWLLLICQSWDLGTPGSCLRCPLCYPACAAGASRILAYRDHVVVATMAWLIQQRVRRGSLDLLINGTFAQSRTGLAQ
jgi:hypothetical protein